jgi:hypothetical protein
LSSSIKWSIDDTKNIPETIALLIHNDQYYISKQIRKLPDSFISIPINNIDLDKGIPLKIDRSVTFDIHSIITTTFPDSELVKLCFQSNITILIELNFGK